jgi:hypothetical protein
MGHVLNHTKVLSVFLGTIMHNTPIFSPCPAITLHTVESTNKEAEIKSNVSGTKML